MSNIEELKRELITQKEAIEKAGGSVAVANQNPTPAEITAGIKTIEYNDVSMATATEADVSMGKTFFAGTPEIKTGTATSSAGIIKGLFLTNNNEKTYNGEINYTIPTDIVKLRAYCFYGNQNTINIKFHDGTTHIEDYAFFNCLNFTFQGLENMSNLKKVGQYGFYYCNLDNVDFGALPESLEYIGAYAFSETVPEYSTIRLTSKMTHVGASAFRCLNRKRMRSFDASTFNQETIPQSIVYNMAFDCNLVLPFKVKHISASFNCGGCFHNIVFHTDVRTLGASSFGSNTTSPLSDFYLKTVVFESETIPSTVGGDVFALQNIENGFKIYVPDTVIEEYKAIKNFSKYVNCIYPMSQKD